MRYCMRTGYFHFRPIFIHLSFLRSENDLETTGHFHVCFNLDFVFRILLN